MNDDLDQAPQEQQELHAADVIAVTAPLPQPVPAGLRNIWRKWLNVTTRPSVASFARELPTANWYDTLMSLIGLGLLSAITRYFSKYSIAQIVGLSHWNGKVADVPIPRWAASSADLVLQPLAFFILVGLLFVAAKGLGGKGTFLEHAYALALIYVPLSIAITIASYVPVIGHVAETILNLYELVLLALALPASHRFTVGRSVLVIVCTPILIIVSLIVIGIVIAILSFIVAIVTSPRLH